MNPVHREAVRDEDPDEREEQLAECLAVAPTIDTEDLEHRGDGGPQPRELVRLPPGGLVAVDELGVLHGVECLVVGGLERLGRAALHGGDGADRHLGLLAEERDRHLARPRGG